jgi:integrase
MIDALSRTLGHLPLELLSKAVSYDYLDACARSGRAERGNKEIALARTIFEWAVATRRVPSNPFDGVRKLKTIRRKRYVTDQEIDLVQEVSKEMGAQYRIVALALKAAYLCVRRSVEVRSLTREMIQADGVRWQDGKQSRSSQKPDVLIEWSPELRAVIDEALNTPRGKLAGVWFVFGNSRGQRYTKGGWKAMLGRLMARASEEAKRKDIPFTPFSLQDCRPKAVSDKLNAGHQDVQDATNHSSGAMVRKHYDVRPLRVAKPVK